MPKYKITANDSERVERSEDPLEFSHTEAATDDAQVALGEMAREKLPAASAPISTSGSRTRPARRSTGNFSAKT